MKYVIFFIAFKVLVYANAHEDQLQKALDILAKDGGSQGHDISQFIKNQIASGKLIIKNESLKSEKRGTVGTVRSKNDKLEIVVDANLPPEEVALTIAHEYMHLSTATYLDRMETSHPNLFKSIERGYSLVNELTKKQKKLSKEEQRDIFTYVIFHFIDEANAYMYEHKLAGKIIKPLKRTDNQLVQHIWEQQESYQMPSISLDLGLKAINVLRMNMPPAETLNALVTTENFESYLKANPNLSKDIASTTNQKPSTSKGSR